MENSIEFFHYHSDTTKLLSNLLYSDPLADSMLSRNVVLHPRALFPRVFYFLTAANLLKHQKVEESEKEWMNQTKQMFEKDADAVIHKLKFNFEKWPKEWKISVEIRDVCIISPSRSLV